MLLDIQKSRSFRQKIMNKPCFKEELCLSESSDEEFDKLESSPDDVSLEFSDHNHNSYHGDVENYGTFYHDKSDEEVCCDLRSRLHHQLIGAPVGLELFAPCNLLERAAQEVLAAAKAEPYGMKGLILHVNLQRKNVCHKLGKIVYDPNTVSTFELFLTFEESAKCWHGLSDLLLTFAARCFNDKVVYLSPSFRLTKHKLYRSNSEETSSIHSL